MKGPDLMQKFWSRLSDQKGAVSFFLAGLALMMFFFTGILIDLAILVNLKAETLSALRMSSSAALSAFDENLLKDFGLLAIADLDFAESLAEDCLRFRLEGRSGQSGNVGAGQSRDQFMQITLKDFEISPVDTGLLVNPKVLEAQIADMMDWQLPISFLDALFSKLDIYKQMAEAGRVFKSKLSYDKNLYRVQEKLEGLGAFLEGLGAEEGFEVSGPGRGKEASMPGRNNGDRQEDFGEMDRAVIKSVASLEDRLHPLISYYAQSCRCLLEATSPEIGAEESAVKRAEAEEWLLEADRYYQSCLKSISKSLELAEEAVVEIEELDEPIRKLDKSYREWGEQIESLPEGSLAQSLRGDYYSSHRPEGGESFSAFAEELDEMIDLLRSQALLWADLALDCGDGREGQYLTDLTREDWLAFMEEEGIASGETAFGSGEIGPDHLLYDRISSCLQGRDEEWSKSLTFSDGSVQLQESLSEGTGQARSGLLEFLSALNQKRKLKAEAKKAIREGRPLPAASIFDYGLDPDFPEAIRKRHEDAGREALAPLLVGSDDSYLAVSLEQIAIVNRFMEVADEPERLIDSLPLISYWIGMFSHRLSPLRAEEDPSILVSLTGANLATRKIYGAELEFLLFGRSRLADNLKQARNWICGLRLIANLLYACTNSLLRQEATGLAFALVGWTGFGVPFIKTLILFIMAVGETWLDVGDLLEGKKLPILKSPENWRFSLSGLKNIAGEAVEDIFQLAEDQLISGVEALEETLTESLDRVKDSAIRSLIDSLRNPLDQLMQSLLTRTDLIEADVLVDFDRLLTSLAAYPMQGEAGGVYREALSELSNFSGDFVELMMILYRSRMDSEGVTEEIIDRSRLLLDELIAPVLDGIKEKLSGLARSWTGEVKKLLSSLEGRTTDKVKEGIDQWIRSFREEIGSGPFSDDFALASSLTMTYEDYLYLILLIKLASDKDALLANTAILIQLEEEEINLLVAPTAIDLKISLRAKLFFLSNRELRLSLFTEDYRFEEGGWTWEESWREGYGRAIVVP